MLVGGEVIGMGRWAAALRLVGVGFYISGLIVLGVVVGLWLDNTLDTGPVFVIIGLLLGIVLAFYGVYRVILSLMSEKQNRGNN